jgi:ABC-type transport system substrate-binding protein
MNNSQFDAVLDKASATYDQNTRISLYREAQTLDFNSLAYYGYLWTQWYNWAHNKRVANLPQLMGGAWDLRAVWLTA